MAKKGGPGKAHREGISLYELTEMFPDEEAATEWFERHVWPMGRHCPRCGSTETTLDRGDMPYWCGACRRRFSVRIGTALERSKVPLRKWVFAIYLEMTSLKGISSMKLHREIKVTQKTAWFMLHRIRETWRDERAALFSGPVEVDETYVGGKRRNMSNAKRKALREADAGRGAVGKATIVGAKDRETNQVRASVIEATDGETLKGFIADHVAPDATVYTDDASAYKGMPFDHDSVNHSASEYVRGMVHTNGIEAAWAMLKRSITGTWHHVSEKHLQRYVNEVTGRHNVREADTIKQMESVVIGLVGKRLMYRDLTA